MAEFICITAQYNKDILTLNLTGFLKRISMLKVCNNSVTVTGKALSVMVLGNNNKKE